MFYCVFKIPPEVTGYYINFRISVMQFGREFGYGYVGGSILQKSNSINYMFPIIQTDKGIYKAGQKGMSSRSFSC